MEIDKERGGVGRQRGRERERERERGWGLRGGEEKDRGGERRIQIPECMLFVSCPKMWLVCLYLFRYNTYMLYI